tara:strand:+ start:81 stop:308 length:228 start_codon:yes stop_codon:yes gene_type:complete
MIYSIFLIFFGMVDAEKSVIVEAACNMPSPNPVSESFSRHGYEKLFADGSILEVDQYSTIIYSPAGNELYFNENP